MHILSCVPNASAHLALDLDVRNPLSSGFALLVCQNRQDKVSRFGQRLSDQEGPRLVPCTKQLLRIGPRQVTVVPPETQRHDAVKDIYAGS